MRHVYGTSNSSPELVQVGIIGGKWLPGWISCLKRIARLKVAITVVLVEVPVDLVRARLQDGAKHAPGGSPVFRGEAVRNRLEFGHRIGRRVDYHIVDALRW